MRKLRYLMAIALVCACTCNASASTDIKVNKEWQQCVLAAIDSFPQNGGYYTGARPNDTFKKTAWKGLKCDLCSSYQGPALVGHQRSDFSPSMAFHETLCGNS